MLTFLTVIYVIVCLFLILVVLLQAGKGGGLGALGGGNSQSVFGGAGAANFMTRLTMVVAALFMILSGTLAYLSSSGQRSLEAAAERAKALEEARALTAADGAGTGDIEAAEQSLAEGIDPLAADGGPGDATPDAAAGSALDVVDQAMDALAADAPEAVEAPEVEPEPAAPVDKPKKIKPVAEPKPAAKPQAAQPVAPVAPAVEAPEPSAPEAAAPKAVEPAAPVKAPTPLESE